MKKSRFFQCCKCDSVTERFVTDDVKVIKCECGGDGIRKLSAPKCFQNTVGRSPSTK